MYKAQQAARQKIPQHRDKGHAGAKAVKAVGQVDGIDQKDNAEKRDGIIRQPQIDHARNREHNAGGQQPQAVQADHKADRNSDLENDLLPGGQAQIAVLDDLDEVIQEADQAIAECEKQHQHACGHLLLAQHFGRRGMEQPIHHAKREQNAKDKTQAAHGGGAVFLVVPGRAFLADGLAKVQAVQSRDQQPAGDGRNGKAANSTGG